MKRVWHDSGDASIAIGPAPSNSPAVAFKVNGFYYTEDLATLDEIIAHLQSLRAEVFGAPKRVTIEQILEKIEEMAKAAEARYGELQAKSATIADDFEREENVVQHRMERARYRGFRDLIAFINAAPAEPGGKEE